MEAPAIVPDAPMVSIFEPVVIRPVVKVRVPLTVSLPARITSDGLLIVRLFKVAVPVMVWADPPLKETVLLPAVNVPVLLQLPYTLKVFELLIVNDALPSIVILWHDAAAPITGWKVAVDGITTSVAEVGTPPHQFNALPQSELINPSHVPVVHDELFTDNLPVAAAK